MRKAARKVVAGCTAMVALVALCSDARADRSGIFGDCGKCHLPTGWKTIRADAKAIDHSRTGFPLVGRHAQVGCTSCHRPDLDLKDPRPGACSICHDDHVHHGAMGGDCSRCHDSRSWRVPRAREIHEATRFQLTGAHLAADCASCHLRSGQDVYTDAPVACVGCHREAYDRPDNMPNHIVGGLSTACEGCHRTSGWRPSRFQHASFFPLTGFHATVACQSCHAGGRFGGTPTTCEGCHLADYRGATDPNHSASNLPLDCSQCHVPVAWRPARTDWHDRLFPITRGKHNNIPCSHCHTGGSDYRMFRCTSCHTPDQTVPGHSGVSGFMSDDPGCYRCHPQGTRSG